MSETLPRLNAALDDRYRIERAIGQGGMATVYLAHDLKHDRPVALKILRPDLAAVMGSERFLSEIRTTANLQHPHILPLHDSGDADGFLFYVMPYVEGESLRARLDREKQLAVDEALRITKAVGNALGYAHRQGVIHRDVKPANVLLHDGEPLVADFGIALAVTAAGAGRLTETGLSLGTPYYMSPEQATADREPGPQSDVYSLACMLYEMLVGDPPHTGSSAQAVLAKILTERPRPVTELRETVPPHIGAALTKALERLPADRFDTAEQFVKALGDVGFTHTAVARADTATTAAAAPAAKRPRGSGAALPWAVAAVATGVAMWSVTARPTASVQVTRDVLTFAEGQQFDEVGPSALDAGMAVSPDGRVLVYEGVVDDERSATQLWSRRLDELGAAPIPGTEGGSAPAFSVDGSSISFYEPDADRLGVISAHGGTPVWYDRGDADRSHAWGDDGAIYWNEWNEPVGSRGIRRWIPGTAEAEVSEYELGAAYVSDVLPGSQIVLMSTLGEMAAVDLRSGEVTELGAGQRPRYVASGHLVFARDDLTLLVRAFDVRSLTFTGPAVSTSAVLGSRGVPEYALGADGTLVYEVSGAASGQELTWVDRTGRSEVFEWAAPGPVEYDGISLDPEGGRVAVAVRDPGTGFFAGDIWVVDLEDGSGFPLTVDGQSTRPQWHPQEERVAYISHAEPRSVRWLATDGSGDGDHLVDVGGAPPQALWAGDAGELIVRQAGASARSIFRYVPEGDGVLQPWQDSEFDEMNPSLSPDGAWLVYVSVRSGSRMVYVQPYPDGGRVTTISIEGGDSPVWSVDGTEIFFVGPDEYMWSAAVSFEGGTIEVDGRERLFELQGSNGSLYDVTSDRRFLMPIGQGGGARDLILVRNWLHEATGGR